MEARLDSGNTVYSDVSWIISVLAYVKGAQKVEI
jgi:hypothetical protein